MCSLLVKEPYNLSFPQIAALTDYQIVEILFRPEHSEPVEHLDMAEAVRRARIRRGLPVD